MTDDPRIAAIEEELAHVYWHNSYLWKEADHQAYRGSMLAHIVKVRLPRYSMADSALPYTRLIELEPATEQEDQ